MKIDKRFAKWWDDRLGQDLSSNFTDKQLKVIKGLCYSSWTMGILAETMGQLEGRRTDIDTEGARYE